MFSWIKIIDKTILKQVLAAILVSFLLITVIWVSPEKLPKIMRHYITHYYTLKDAVEMVLLTLTQIIVIALPVGILLGTLFTFDKLSRDSEITVLRSFGFSFNRIVLPIAIVSIIFAGLCFVVFDRFIPWSYTRYNEINKENPNDNFVYTFKDKQNIPQKIMIVSNFDNEVIEDIVVLNFSHKTYNDANFLSNIFIADKAFYKNNKWTLDKAKRYDIDENGVFKFNSEVKNVLIADGEKAKNIYKLMTYSVKRDREFTNQQLHSYIELLKQEGLTSEYNAMLHKYLQRYFNSIICILFAILGCLLGFSNPREQRLIGFTLATLVVFLYYSTMPCMDFIAERGLLSPYVTALIQPLFVLIMIIIIKKVKDI